MGEVPDRFRQGLTAIKGVLSFCYMATLLIRDLPDEIDERLAEAAAAARRSKEKQAMFLIESGLMRRKRNHAEMLAEAKRIHAMFKGKPTTMKEILEWTEAEH